MANMGRFDLAEFQCKNVERVQEKLRQFKAAGQDQIHVVFDFDHTLSASVRSSESVGTWAIVDEFLPQEIRERHGAIYRHYRPIERSGHLTEDEAINWWSQTLDLICSAHFNLFKTEQGFLDAVSLRSGVKDLFDFCYQANIPTVILSAGIKQLIEIFVAQHNIKPRVILATQLKTTVSGEVIGWESETLVHALNKHERGHAELLQICEARPYTVLIGDGPEDALMVEGQESVLRVCIADPRAGEKIDRHTFLEQSYRAGFDLVVDSSMEPIVRLFQYISAL